MRPALATGRIVFSVTTIYIALDAKAALFISLDLQIWFAEQISVLGLCAVEMFLAVRTVHVLFRSVPSASITIR